MFEKAWVALKNVWEPLNQGSPNYSQRNHFVKNEKYIHEAFADLIDVTQREAITSRKDVRPSYCCVIAYMALGQKRLETLN